MRKKQTLKEIFEGKRNAKLGEFALIDDMLMKEYGWIPIDDLRMEPITRILDLIKIINERRKEEQKQAKKVRRR